MDDRSNASLRCAASVPHMENFRSSSGGWFPWVVGLLAGATVGIITSLSVASATTEIHVIASTGLAAFITTTVAVAGLIVSYATATATDRKTQIEFFLEIARVLKTDDMRRQKRELYDLSRTRANYQDWTKEQKSTVRSFCGNLDLIAVLANARQVDTQSLLEMYGDVIFRTFYVSAPVISELVEARGHHHLIPIRRFIPELHSAWAKAAKRNELPSEIGMPGDPDLVLTPENYLDEHVRAAIVVGNKPFGAINKTLQLTANRHANAKSKA
jgi:hypothetical protein